MANPIKGSGTNHSDGQLSIRNAFKIIVALTVLISGLVFALTAVYGCSFDTPKG